MDLTMSFAVNYFKNQVLGIMLLFKELKLATILVPIFLIILFIQELPNSGNQRI